MRQHVGELDVVQGIGVRLSRINQLSREPARCPAVIAKMIFAPRDGVGEPSLISIDRRGGLILGGA